MEIACELIEILRPGEPLAESKPEPLAKAELRELDGHFVREINRARWVKAQMDPDELRTSFSHEHSPSTRLDLRLAFDVRSPVPRGRRAPVDVRRLTEKLAYLAIPLPLAAARWYGPPCASLGERSRSTATSTRSRSRWRPSRRTGDAARLAHAVAHATADRRLRVSRAAASARMPARSSVRAGRWKGVPWVVELALRAGRQA